MPASMGLGYAGGGGAGGAAARLRPQQSLPSLKASGLLDSWKPPTEAFAQAMSISRESGGHAHGHGHVHAHSQSQSRTLNGTHSRDASSKGDERRSRNAVVSEQPAEQMQMTPPRRSGEGTREAGGEGEQQPRRPKVDASKSAKTEEWIQSQRMLNSEGGPGRAEPPNQP